MSKITTKHDDGIFYLNLNNPEKRNALDAEMMSEVSKTLNTLSKDLSSLKAVVISGEGKSFCAGADLNWMKEMADYSLEENIADSHKLYDLFYSIYSFPLPVIVKAHGHVFGGGLGLLAAADFVIGDKSCLYCFSEVKLGLAPAVISSFILSKCNSSDSQALMTSALVFTHEEALKLGLVNMELSDERFNQIIKSYKDSGQEGLIATKKLCLTQRTLKPEDFKELTIEIISSLRTTTEAQTRMKSFLERKK